MLMFLPSPATNQHRIFQDEGSGPGVCEGKITQMKLQVQGGCDVERGQEVQVKLKR